MGKKAQTRRLAKNEAEAARPAPQAKPGQVVKVSDATFGREVLDEDGLVLVDFWAPWCGPCKAVAPILDELAVSYAGRVKIAKVDTESNRGIPTQFNIRSIPTMILFRDGQLVDVKVGASPKGALERWLDRNLEPKQGLLAKIFG